ncbi:MAG TPA: cation:proton antiporter [Burkholderiales bacterium]|nr:cation:proton antiporter [Burkholderiales bacterium]
MGHGLNLVSTIAVSFGLAMVFGYAAARLRMPPMIGYLLAGIVIGPFTPGFVADVALARELADVGVMLLMFGVGLHFSLGDLLQVRRIAVPGALIQMAAATALGAGTALLWGWSPGAALVLGLALSVASTVVLLRMLESRGALNSGNGHIAVGWLVVQDLAMVLVLVLLPPFAHMHSEGVALALALTIGKVAAFFVLMLVAGRRLLPRLLWFMARTGSRELFTLCVVAAAVGVAYVAAALFEVSFALGAFFAGMMMRESELSHRAAEQSLPLRDAFAVLFFVSVGMLFDPRILLQDPGKLLATAAIVVVGTPLVAMALVLSFRYPLNSALMIGASLAQIGEFSFILAALGTSLGLLPAEGQSLVIAAAILSIALNPLLFSALRPAHAWLTGRSALARRLETSDDPLAALPMSTAERYLSGQVVLVGYGRVGRRIAEALDRHEVPYVVAEENRERVEELRGRNIPAVSGDASQPSVLIQAHIAKAGMLIIATPDTVSVRRMAEIARTLNPGIEIVVRTHDEEEAALLARDAGLTVFYGEKELASTMTRHVLARRGIDAA